MKIAYIKGNKVSLSQEVKNMKAYNNSVLEKISYEKFKKAIKRCFYIISSMCVGISFGGLVSAYDLNNPEIAMYGHNLVEGFGIGLLNMFWTIWGIGYMISKMRNHSFKEVVKEFSGMFVQFGIVNIISIGGGTVLWELVRMILQV